ncbi:DNA-binding transcriptional regulator, MarR family [Bradyrhizobium sp. Rc2d]|uniref:MarR family winged helix-turn-helix transcriptional regulator n=1 Tax=Bradyrhizobium sp. Rc2d TaxID=1855321 RepID=UPI00088A865C|nr:MarR family winged helix-turn-helix transcriptional regulator [Bradyrhizobium sp. Rc2d]SDG37087.1 DNA-binding transcriptional regulator, MarR family [Bradyrhizobium sp. Rc2d]
MPRAATKASNLVDDPARCNCNQVRRAARRLSRYYDLALASSGLKSTQYSLLGYLVTSGPMTMAQLAKLMSMDRATTGHNLRPLVRDGFVEISVGKNDRRERIVTITRQGHKTHGRALAAWRLAQTAFEEAMGEQEAADLRDLMKRIVDLPLPRPE